jgi:hypothetical protein
VYLRQAHVDVGQPQGLGFVFLPDHAG